MAHVKPPLFKSEKSVDRAIADLMSQFKQVAPKEAGE
jgi:hypothetical protein